MNRLRLFLFVVSALWLLNCPSIQAGTAVARVAETGSDFQQALSAELAFYPNAVTLDPEAVCDSTTDPAGGACIVTVSDDATASAGIAVFGVEYPNMPQVRDVLGRMVDGSWQPWFRAGDVIYQLVTLPGPMMVCAEGNLVNVKAGPSATAATTKVLTDRTSLSADSFLLTQAGSFSATAAPPGDIGWYHLTAPVDGWIPSQSSSDAALGTCSWHDALHSLN